MKRCGSCSLCCKLLGIDELEKPANRWCQHCSPGMGGCQIYETRPVSCREFECLWLQIDELPDGLYPQSCKCVLGMTGTGENAIVYVDPTTPDAYRKNKHVVEFILKNLRGGKDVFVVCGDKRKILPAKGFTDVPDISAHLPQRPQQLPIVQ